LRLAAQRTLRAPPIPCAFQNPASLPDFGIGVCLRQTPSIRHWRIAMETAASMPQPPRLNFHRKVEKVKKVKEVEGEKVPGTVFLDKKLSINLVPGTFAGTIKLIRLRGGFFFNFR
jgi:hypothetical protein